MRTETLPRVKLAHLPTPLERLPRLSESLGIDLWMKRDDCTGLALGGNKTRKLEFTLGEALAQGADTLVTCGGYQSNHVRQTAAAAARLGMECHAVISLPPSGRGEHYFRSGNLLLDHLVGARIHVAPDAEAGTDSAVDALLSELRQRGRRPFFVPLGASDAVGAVGYAECARELLDQCREAGISPGTIVLVTGSAGTHAGLLAGLRSLHAPVEIIGFSSSEPSEIKYQKVLAIIPPLLDRIGSTVEIGAADVIVHDAYVGGGYAIPTAEANAAIAETAAAEGILLDPVYTGKAMAGLMDLVRTGRFNAPGPVVFLHTGGAPALFVYEDEFWDGVAEG